MDLRLAPVFLGVLIVTAACTSVRSKSPPESLERLVHSIMEQQVAALERYLDAYPEAPDAEKATDLLIQSLSQTGHPQEALRLLHRKYERWARDPAATNSDQVFSWLLLPGVALYRQVGDREPGRVFLLRALQDFPGIADDEPWRSRHQELQDRLDLPMPGDLLPFSLRTMSGETLSLSNLQGRAVLLDFWSADCDACAEDLADLRRTYDQFRTEGLVIIGVSLDLDADRVARLVGENEIEWPVVCDGQGWESPLVRLYGVNRTPATFLLAQDGHIAAIDLRGEALAAKITELFQLPAAGGLGPR